MLKKMEKTNARLLPLHPCPMPVLATPPCISSPPLVSVEDGRQGITSQQSPGSGTYRSDATRRETKTPSTFPPYSFCLIVSHSVYILMTLLAQVSIWFLLWLKTNSFFTAVHLHYKKSQSGHDRWN